MTMDDESSVYVGGLAYDSTEDMLQKAFEPFGDINSIKVYAECSKRSQPHYCFIVRVFEEHPKIVDDEHRIVYDRESGQSRGFGFVTFTNPRAASKAIHGLDGGTLGGRTIRVNEVKKNSGKSLSQEASFRDRGERDREHRDSRDRDRDRERSGRGRNLSPKRNRRSSPGPGRSARGRSPVISPGAGRSTRVRSPAVSPVPGRTTRNRSPTHRRSRSPRAGRSTSFNSSSGGRPRAHSSPTPSPQSSGRLHHVEDRTRRTPTLNSRVGKDKQTDVVKVREELDRAVQSRRELEDKVANLTSAVEQAKETVSSLHAKNQKLEESLASALATESHQQQQLRKLQKGILQVRDSSERLKCHEKELKALISSTISDMEVMDVEPEDRQVALGNGGHYHADRNVDDGSSLLTERIKG